MFDVRVRQAGASNSRVGKPSYLPVVSWLTVARDELLIFRGGCAGEKWPEGHIFAAGSPLQEGSPTRISSAFPEDEERVCARRKRELAVAVRGRKSRA